MTASVLLGELRPVARSLKPLARHQRSRHARRLRRYDSPLGPRELVMLAGAAGSRLLVDRTVGTHSDSRLLAHLAPDEPDVNAHHVCREYLADGACACRRLAPGDFTRVPAADPTPVASIGETAVLEGRDGSRYRLVRASASEGLRWVREEDGGLRRVSVRQVVGALEDYEPVRSLTRSAIGRFRSERSVSIGTLAVELRRLEVSPIVLNRGLRQAVLTAVARDGVSLSAIAIACGRIKRDRNGNHSGETSWLARRVGLLCEHGAARPNPWVHSDTLALIAREGLGIAPREVEIG